jgi:hypothetical protein
LPLFPLKASRSQAEKVDRAGTELWNTVVKKLRDLGSSDATPNESLALCKALAALLIDSATKSATGTKRVTHVLLGAARTCLWANQFTWGTRLLERVASHSPEPNRMAGRLEGEYYVLRILLVSHHG